MSYTEHRQGGGTALAGSDPRRGENRRDGQSGRSRRAESDPARGGGARLDPGSGFGQFVDHTEFEPPLKGEFLYSSQGG